jgi:dihydroflavonol-4-reductase
MTQAPAWLVTGATGFLGRHLLLALRRQSPAARLVVLVRDRRAWESLDWTARLGAVEVVEGALVPTGPWQDDPRLQGVQGIFHLAAIVHHSRRSADAMFHTNVAGTVAMTELAARLACRLLFMSTSGTVSCAPRPGQGAFEDGRYCEHVVGRWPYYASKIAAERQARERAMALGVELVIMRPPILLGPGDHRFRSTGSVLRLLQGRLPAIVRGGMHFADVRDAADAMLQAMQTPQPRPVYHLAGTASTVDEFFRSVAEIAGVRASWRVLPAGALRAAARLNAWLGAPLSALPDPVLVEMASHYWDHRSRFAETELGYACRAPEETLRDTVQWLRAHHPELCAQPGDEAAPRYVSR